MVCAPAPSFAQATLPPNFEDHRIVGGLSTPTGMAALPDGRVLVTEQLTARIRLIVNGALSSVDPVVTVPGVRNDDFFRGLLGIAVDPRWPSSPYVYVHFAATNGKLMISRFTAAGDLAFSGNGALTIDPATRYDLFTDLYDAAHNGGALRFGPDQMLYASVGDSIHSSCAAQNLATLRGVVLRLEIRNLPAGAGGPPARSLITPPDNPFVTNPNLNARLVWVRGLRNPFRFQIDRTNGVLFISDVGEGAWEEIDRAQGGGHNFGWPLFEGPSPFRSCPGVSGTGLTSPIHAYSDGMSVIGAGATIAPPVRRRDSRACTKGASSSATTTMERCDASSGAVRAGRSRQRWRTAELHRLGIGHGRVSDYLMAPDGSLWYCRQSVDFAANTGMIRRIVYSGVLATDDPPMGVGLLRAYPSPSSAGLDLTNGLPARAIADLMVFDLAGREVRCLESRGEREAGMHRVHWDGRASDGRRRAPGVYLVRLRWNDTASTRRIVIAR